MREVLDQGLLPCLSILNRGGVGRSACLRSASCCVCCSIQSRGPLIQRWVDGVLVLEMVCGILKIEGLSGGGSLQVQSGR